MAHYIDADKLIAEIERYIKDVKDAEKRFTPNMGFFEAKLSGIYDVMSIVASHQQEQQEEPDKSLEEEIATWIPAHISIGTDETLPVNPTELADACKEWGKCIARHFAEWQKEQMMKEAVEELFTQVKEETAKASEKVQRFVDSGYTTTR